MPESTLILRPLLPEEAQRLHDLYVRWDDPMVLPRSTASLRDAALRGVVFVVEDDASREWIGATGVFDLTDEYVESGGTYVEEAYRGFGLQSIFFQIRAAVVAMYYGTGIHFTTAVDPTNQPSLKPTIAAGCVPMTAIAEQVGDACTGCKKLCKVVAPRICCCDFYRMPLDAARANVKRLLARFPPDGKAALNAKDGRTRDLIIRARVISDAETRIAMQEFVDGATW